MTRTKLFFAFALVFVPLAVLTSAPAPTDQLRLAPAGKIKVDNLGVNDACLIDDNLLVLVGRTGDFDPSKDAPKKAKPNGAIIDLTKKSVQSFTNGHKTQIWGVSSYGGRVVSGGTELDPFVRIWDLEAHRTSGVIKVGTTYCRVRCFHNSYRVVSDGLLHLVVLDPAKPGERTKLRPPHAGGWTSSATTLAVSPDDASVVCTAEQDQVVCFDVATGKATAVRITPKDAGEKWFMHGFAFSPSGKLFVCRGFGDEVPEGKTEKDVPADRRGIVRIDLPEGKVVPLRMGHTCGTLACAVDGKETWLATVGHSWPDKPANGKSAGELRVYHLSSGKLVYREQWKGMPPLWVWFTPSGKRLVCVATDGTVRWWDVPVR